ncbi:MAG: LPP20 family lipoprotein [Elusimicrobiota bacterium]
MKKIVLITVLFFVFSNFLYAKKPDWLNGVSRKYNSEEYIIGVGMSSSLDDARSAGRAEIAKVFESRIAQTAQSYQFESNSNIEKKKNIDSGISSDIKTMVETDEILEGVKIAGTYYDKKKKTYYALAVLDKQKTRIALAQDIADKEEIVETNVAIADKAGSPIEQVKALNQAIVAANEKNGLIAKKRVVDSMAMPEITDNSIPSLKNKKDNAVKKILFVIEAQPAELATMVAGSVAQLGLRTAVAEPEEPLKNTYVVNIKCSLNVEPSAREYKDWSFYRWDGTFEMYESANKDSALNSANKQGEVSHMNDEAAKEKAVYMGSKALAQLAESSVREYLGN